MELEVRTRSIQTAAALILLGHAPIGVVLDPVVAPTLRFPATAARDLRRFLDAKAGAEEFVRAGTVNAR